MKLPCAKCSADCGMFTWCESCMRAATVRGTQASRTLIEVRTAAEIYGFTGADDELARWLVKKLAPTLKQNISRTSGAT